MSAPYPMTAALRKKGEKLPPLKDRLARLGLVNDWDFVLHLPLRYEDRTHVTPIAELAEESWALVQGRVIRSEVRFGKFTQLIAEIEDETASIEFRFLHFYPSQRKLLEVGNLVRAFGQVKKNPMNGFYQMIHPKVNIAKDVDEALPSNLTPVYPAGEGIQQRWLTQRIDRALLDVELTDLVPKDFLKVRGLPDFATAVKDLHHPPKGADTKSYMERTCPAWERLKLDELLAQQITLLTARNERRQHAAHAMKRVAGGFYDQFLKTLPFDLTGAQKRALSEVESDLAQDRPMHRLVQGDVGCGKTVVAALSALVAIDAGFQAALMAPTEILAEQHFEKLNNWLTPLGVRVLWLSGSLKAKDKAAAQATIASGEADLVIGTHALIQDAVNFSKLGLAIVDEQHRFGVAQRLKLRTHAVNDCVPHLLMLSATPIPRTLAMSYLADVDVSVIDELPAGRTPIVTKLISLTRIDEVINSIGIAVKDHRQCYWVCPLIEESEKAELTAAKMRAETLKAALPECRIGLVHGAMTPEEKQSQMQLFSQGEIDVLVATTVIEVGVDVPNASIMVIEHAERFGLSQLHQLRGRVGRGSVQSLCILLFDSQLSDTGKARLKTIKNSNDGFAIAREDLKLRGPGEFMGAKQSGVPSLRFADLEEDALLIEEAKIFAQQWLTENPETARKHARRWFSSHEEFMNA